MIISIRKAVFLLSLLIPLFAHSQDIYVDGVNGSDANDGLAPGVGNAKLTVAAGLSTITAGNNLFITTGTYNETVTIDKAITIVGTGGTATIGQATLSADIGMTNVNVDNVFINTSGVFQDAVDIATPTTGFITASTGTYNETVTIDKSLSLTSDGNPITITNLTLTSGATLTTDANMTITGTVTLTSGIIDAQGTFYLSPTASDITESTTSYVTGTVEVQTRTIGAGSMSFLGASISAGTSIGDVSISRTTGSSGITSGTISNSIACTWTITSTIDPSDRTLVLNWYDNWDNVVTTGDQSIWQDDGGGWSILSNPTESSATPRSLTSGTNPTKFGDFTIAAQNANLPVELTYIKAYEKLDYVLLQWQTASEINHDYFEIQRGEDGENFEALDRMSSHHNSTSINNYEWVDNSPLSGKAFYRLKMVDYDGYTEYSPIVSASSSYQNLTLHPNPTSNVLNITSASNANGIEVFNTSGKKMNPTISGNQIDVSGFLPGIYLVKMITDSDVIQSRFIKE